jgi:hypothetical protein
MKANIKNHQWYSKIAKDRIGILWDTFKIFQQKQYDLFIIEKYSQWLQVSSRLADLEATLDAGIRHRNKALSSVGGHLAKWMDMVRVSFWTTSCLRVLCCLCRSLKEVLIFYHCLIYEPIALIFFILS